MNIAFTGHRPSFLPCQYDESHSWAIKVRENLTSFIITLEQDTPITDFISGVAQGWDTWGAEIALVMGYGVRAYLPFLGQAASWSQKDVDRYCDILFHPYTDIVYTGQDYSRECFFVRDRAMVDDCDMLLSLLNPETKSGGTYYTVMYCMEKYPDKKIINFWI